MPGRPARPDSHLGSLEFHSQESQATWLAGSRSSKKYLQDQSTRPACACRRPFQELHLAHSLALAGRPLYSCQAWSNLTNSTIQLACELNCFSQVQALPDFFSKFKHFLIRQAFFGFSVCQPLVDVAFENLLAESFVQLWNSTINCFLDTPSLIALWDEFTEETKNALFSTS